MTQKHVLSIVWTFLRRNFAFYSVRHRSTGLLSFSTAATAGIDLATEGCEPGVLPLGYRAITAEDW